LPPLQFPPAWGILHHISMLRILSETTSCPRAACARLARAGVHVPDVRNIPGWPFKLLTTRIASYDRARPVTLIGAAQGGGWRLWTQASVFDIARPTQWPIRRKTEERPLRWTIVTRFGLFRTDQVADREAATSPSVRRSAVFRNAFRIFGLRTMWQSITTETTVISARCHSDSRTRRSST